MRCPFCKQNMTVHIYNAVSSSYEYYCESCERRIGNQKRCSVCKTAFLDYIESGLLGCENCYKDHSQDLLTVLPSYFQKAPIIWPERKPDRMAISRTATAHEVFGAETNTGDLPCEQSVIDIENQIRPFLSRQTIRIRIARNLSGISYLHLLPKKERSLLKTLLLGPGSSTVRMIEQFSGKRGIFLSKHDLSQLKALDFFSKEVTATVYWPNFLKGSLWLYTGDEDHIRLQYVTDRPLSTEQAENLSEILHRFDQFFVWQYSRTFGFLNACPSNSGSGCRISVATDIIADRPFFRAWSRALSAIGVELRSPGQESPNNGRVILTTRNNGRPVEIFDRLWTLIRLSKRMASKMPENRPGLSSTGPGDRY